jgi:hypothetical protein
VENQARDGEDERHLERLQRQVIVQQRPIVAQPQVPGRVQQVVAEDAQDHASDQRSGDEAEEEEERRRDQQVRRKRFAPFADERRAAPPGYRQTGLGLRRDCCLSQHTVGESVSEPG